MRRFFNKYLCTMAKSLTLLMALTISCNANAQTVKVHKTFNNNGTEEKTVLTVVDADYVEYSATTDIDEANDIMVSLNNMGAYGAQPLKGKKILVIGDDYAWQNSFGKYLASATGCTVRARGIKGGVLKDVIGDKYNKTGATTFISESFNNTALKDVDLVVVMAGLYNWANNYAVGTIDDINNFTSTTSVYAETKLVIDAILSYHPNMKIVFCTQPYCGATINGLSGYAKNSKGATLEDTMNAIKRCAAFHGIPCFDFYHESGWNYLSVQSPFTNCIYTADGFTPRSGDGKGADMLGSRLGRFINLNAK